MTEPYKVCPICDTSNHRSATMCVTCGTSLTDVPLNSGDSQLKDDNYEYDFRYGETDLLEQTLQRKAQAYLVGFVSVLGVVMVIGLLIAFGPFINRLFTSIPSSPDNDSGVVSPLSGESATPAPTIALSTVTQGPPTLTPSFTPSLTPTITPTPTREPCMQTVGPGDGLYLLVSRCGHNSLDVVQQVIDLNSLNNEQDIRPGQVIIIPWPTETLDPNALPPADDGGEGEGESSSGDTAFVGLSAEDIAATQAVDPFFAPTATNPPGVGDHIISRDETITSISIDYDTSIEVLEQLNPEITFSQCDFGLRFGGDRCIVSLIEGQRIRVPIPTPTPSLTPSPNGSETPTPTPTSTYNAPNPLRPSNNAFFRRDEFVTLRWSSSAFLLRGEAYRVTVKNLTNRQVNVADTTELSFVIPAEWQGTEDQRYEYEWTIAIVKTDDPDTLLYETEPRTFTWEGRGE